jgi:hypothetical protein
MAGNDFNKEEKVAFDELLMGFNDAEVMSRNVNIYRTDQTQMERAQDTIWRPRPYIMPSFDGADQTGNFTDKTQLAVPATIGFRKSSPWEMTSTQLRDALQEGRLGDGAKQKLASDINRAVLDVASLQGSLVVPVAAAASGFDDVALCEAIMNEQGVPAWDRYLSLSTKDYNNMASNLADRGTFTGDVRDAYRDAFVGRIASFDTFKLDYAKRIAAAGGGAITISTLDAANDYTPQGVTTSPTTGERLNKDNRFQTVTVTATAGVVAGDAFTIADINAVHQITKEDTGELKTFRVISVDTGTTMTITPPLITNQVANAASEQYQNSVATAKSATAAITWLNIDPARINPFWQMDAIEILPGRIATPENSGTSVLRGTTDSGLELVMMKQHDIVTDTIKYRVDTLFGVVNKDPEQSGILIFDQVP